MTFNQWAAGKDFNTSERLAVEAVWNELSGAGCSPYQTGRLLTDLVEALSLESEDDDWEDDE